MCWKYWKARIKSLFIFFLTVVIVEQNVDVTYDKTSDCVHRTPFFLFCFFLIPLLSSSLSHTKTNKQKKKKRVFLTRWTLVHSMVILDSFHFPPLFVRRFYLSLYKHKQIWNYLQKWVNERGSIVFTLFLKVRSIEYHVSCLF